MAGAGAARGFKPAAHGPNLCALLLLALATRAAAVQAAGSRTDVDAAAAAAAAAVAFPLGACQTSACDAEGQAIACDPRGTKNPSRCLCDATHFGPNCSSVVTDDVAAGFCKDLHTWQITGLGTTYYSALSALFLFLSFIWILRANNKNMRLAIAGDTSGKVITISWYTKVMDAAMIWAIGWSVYKFFSVDHGSAVRSGDAGDAQKWHYAATAVVRAYVMARRPPC